jgi:hypothetical protein
MVMRDVAASATTAAGTDFVPVVPAVVVDVFDVMVSSNDLVVDVVFIVPCCCGIAFPNEGVATATAIAASS